MSNIYLVTGTDTDVGKTVFSKQLYLELKRKNKNPFIFKPAESGLELGPQDANSYLEVMPKGTKLNDIVGYQLQKPLAPSVAARLEGIEIDYKKIIESINLLAKEYSSVIVEGAGGILVPINDDKNYLDLAKDLNAKVVVVVASKLGCINHALLTFDCLNNAGVNISGYVFNDINNSTSDVYQKPAINSNRQRVAKLS